MIVAPGIPDNQIETAIDLYWEAFGAKLGTVMGPEQKAKQFIRSVIDPSHAICALDNDQRVLGVAGFKTYEGALVGGKMADLWKVYGLSSLWRAAVLTLLERDIENKRFLMDGIFVCASERGKGVGSALLSALYEEAKNRGYSEIRLDVIDSNPRAKSLYEREGFVATKSQSLGPLSLIFGFKSATAMVRNL